MCDGRFRLGKKSAHRKQWIEERPQQLVKFFAIGLAGFALMDNPLHLLLRLDPGRAKSWTVEDVVRRWLQLCPLMDRAGKPVIATAAWMAARALESA